VVVGAGETIRGRPPGGRLRQVCGSPWGPVQGLSRTPFNYFTWSLNGIDPRMAPPPSTLCHHRPLRHPLSSPLLLRALGRTLQFETWIILRTVKIDAIEAQLDTALFAVVGGSWPMVTLTQV
jgi:hypothetical protein